MFTRFSPVDDTLLALFLYLENGKDLLVALIRVIKNRITSMKKMLHELTYNQKCVILNRITLQNNWKEKSIGPHRLECFQIFLRGIKYFDIFKRRICVQNWNFHFRSPIT